MQVQTINCNNCGAPLDVPPDANFATCTHCGSRLAIKRNESATYTEVLDRIDQRTATISQDLEDIRLQNELEQIDREWQIEREKYRQTGEDGSSSLPSGFGTIGVVIGGAIAVVFGFIFVGFAGSMGAPGFISVFGVVFVLVAIGGVMATLLKTSQYSEAENEYRLRREQVLQRMKRGS